jgi:hypothetical protein
MTSKLEVYNLALGNVGERKLASLAENVEARRALDDHYDRGVGYCLERGMWNFAKRVISITSSDDVEPSFGYTYAFEKPADWIRTMRVSDNERLIPPLLEYQDEAGIWYADFDPLYIEYVSNGTSYGLNLSLWSETFTDYVAASLARRICRRITSSENKQDELEKAEAKALKVARAADAMNQPVGFPPAGTWVTSRMAGRTRRSRWDGSSS